MEKERRLKYKKPKSRGDKGIRKKKNKLLPLQKIVIMKRFFLFPYEFIFSVEKLSKDYKPVYYSQFKFRARQQRR